MPINIVAPRGEASQLKNASPGDPFHYHSPNPKDPFVPRVFLFASFEEKAMGRASNIDSMSNAWLNK
ncbi:hypothetical protein VrSk94_39630 [Vibrio rotiferianus]